MRVLGIESSCDESGVALYDTEQGLLADVLHSQIDLHALYGGVVPELASRDHIRRLPQLIETVRANPAVKAAAIDAIAYTSGPGLAGALLVGASLAQALAYALKVPALPIHHLEGHLLSPLLAEHPPSFPFVALLVSGGHTQLMRVDGVGRYSLLGETLDDAAGEAFDKTAKLLNLGYPGGPALAALAQTGQTGRYALPRPMLKAPNLSFSFSGLKTAVLTQVNAPGWQEADAPDLAADFQAAVVDVLVYKALKALKQTKLKQLVVAGGVGANKHLREQLNAGTAKIGAQAFYPPLSLCTDNGAMIAFAGAQRLLAGQSPSHSLDIAVRPRWPLTELQPPC